MRDSSFRKTSRKERKRDNREDTVEIWLVIFRAYASNVWLTLVLEVEFTPYLIAKDSISTRREKKRERGIKYFVRDEILLSFSGEQWFFFFLLFFPPTLFLFATIWSSRSFFTISSSLLRISPFIYIHRSVYRLHVKKKTAHNTRTYTEVESLEGGWRWEGGGQFETAASACDWWSTSEGIVRCAHRLKSSRFFSSGIENNRQSAIRVVIKVLSRVVTSFSQVVILEGG